MYMLVIIYQWGSTEFLFLEAVEVLKDLIVDHFNYEGCDGLGKTSFGPLSLLKGGVAVFKGVI